MTTEKKLLILILGTAASALLSPLFFYAFKIPQIIKALRTGYYQEQKYYTVYAVDDLGDILSIAFFDNRTYIFTSIIFGIAIIFPLAVYFEVRRADTEVPSFLQKWKASSIWIAILTLILFGPYNYLSSIGQLLLIHIISPIVFALYITALLEVFIYHWTDKKN